MIANQSPESDTSISEPVARRRAGWLRLADVPEGKTARLRERDLRSSDRDLLTGLGLIPDRRLVVCKTGSPCIVAVRGVRVGLSAEVADRLLVELVDEPPAGG